MKRNIIKYKYDKVLLIDDNPLDNFINGKMIESTSFAERIYVNTNGLSALEFIKNLAVTDQTDTNSYPDVIFVDLNMPVMNGFQFIENFIHLPDDKLKKCKIVILTSSACEQDKETAEKIYKDVIFLKKPLTSEVLNSL